MSKTSNLRLKGRRLLALGLTCLLTITLTSCSAAELELSNSSSTYLSVGDYSVTYEEVWNELRWSASDLLEDYKEYAVLQEYVDTIIDVLASPSNEDYDDYVFSLQNYILEDCYSLSFSLESHDDEIDEFSATEKKQYIQAYADTTYANYRVDITIDEIVSALTNENYDELEPLYTLYYLDLAARLYAEDCLAEEIAEADEEAAEDDDEDEIGYFTKSQIVTEYEDSFYNQGDVDVIMIKFASEDEMNETLRAFGIYVYDGRFYYLTDTPTSYNEYKRYYENFDFDEADTDEYFDLDASFGHSIILQLYIAMYNYIYSGYANRGEIFNIKEGSIGFENNSIIDQRSVTQALIEYYQENNLVFDEESDDARLEVIIDAALESTDDGEFITYTAEFLQDLDEDLYTYIYEELQTPTENELLDNTTERYATTSNAYSNDDSNYYLVFKIDQVRTDDDLIYYDTDGEIESVYNLDLSTDEKYELIAADSTLLARIKENLTLEDLTESYISSCLEDALEYVSIKIYDQAIEIAYSVDNDDYSKTLSSAPDNNTVALITYDNDDADVYNQVTVKLEGDEDDFMPGLWETLEYRLGITTAADLICTKMIKDSEEYKAIDEEVEENLYYTVEYLLAAFANDSFSDDGYSSEIGKYNFLMLYYHTADIDEIVSDHLKVSYVIQNVLTNYSSDLIVNFFQAFATSSYNTYFSITADMLSVYLDIDEDGEPDEIDNWEQLTVTWDDETYTYAEVAQMLINDIYTLLLSSTDDHSTTLEDLVDAYNSSSRYNPHEGDRWETDSDGYYDPIGDEWDFSKYKKLGFAVSIEEVTVTNSSTDVNTAIKDTLYLIYNEDGFIVNDTYPSYYLPSTNYTVLADNAYNWFVITDASGPYSAKYLEKDDDYNLYANLYYMYNEGIIYIENVYNDGDILNFNQVKAYLMEYLESETSNLLPEDISDALTYLSEILERFQSDGTQYLIIFNYICNSDYSLLTWDDEENATRLEIILEINARATDEYIDYGDNEELYNAYYGWWEALNALFTDGGSE